MNKTEYVRLWRNRDCDAFQKFRRRARCKNILNGLNVRERVTAQVKVELARKDIL